MEARLLRLSSLAVVMQCIKQSSRSGVLVLVFVVLYIVLLTFERTFCGYIGSNVLCRRSFTAHFHLLRACLIRGPLYILTLRRYIAVLLSALDHPMNLVCAPGFPAVVIPIKHKLRLSHSAAAIELRLKRCVIITPVAKSRDGEFRT
jgi:hypothetical protein